MWKTFVTSLGTAIVAFLIAVVTIPTDFVVGRLKFALNRAEQRDERSARLSEEVSTYIFAAQTFHEFFSRDLDQETVKLTIKEYNDAITNLRAHEYVNRATIRRYWSEATAHDFDAFMANVRRVDALVHGINDPMIRFVTDPAKPLVLKDADVKRVAVSTGPPLAALCRSGEALLFSLSGVETPSDRKTCG